MEENFEFSEEAKFELHRAQCYFKLIERDDDFLNDFMNQLSRVRSMPHAFQIRYKSVRIIHFEHFNYAIHFRLKEDGAIAIYHILNQNQEY